MAVFIQGMGRYSEVYKYQNSRIWKERIFGHRLCVICSLKTKPRLRAE